MACFVQVLVVVTDVSAIFARWDDRRCAHGLDKLEEPILIGAFVADDGVTLQPLEQGVGLGTLVALTSSEQQLQWITECIDGDMALGAEATPTPAEGLSGLPTLFFDAPAAQA